VAEVTYFVALPFCRCRRWHCGRRTDRMLNPCGGGPSCAEALSRKPGVCRSSGIQPNAEISRSAIRRCKAITQKVREVPARDLRYVVEEPRMAEDEETADSARYR